MKVFDSYTTYARFFPSLICALPILLIINNLVIKFNLHELLTFITGISLFGALSFNIVMIYFFSLINRTLSKFFERKYFINKDGFPTAYFLLFNNQRYSKELKLRYRTKVLKLFNIKIPNEQEEILDQKETIRILSETAKQIILLVGDGKLVKQHNIWYGFFRNLIGGSMVALLFSICGLIIYNFILYDVSLTIIFLISTFVFLLILIFNKVILIPVAEEYANQLISEFFAI